MPLTDIKIKNAKPAEKPFKISDGGGLFIVVQPTGSKWWRYKYRFAGKEKLLALGAYPDVALAEARELHSQARKALAAGNDPSEVKKEAKRLVTLKAENNLEAIAREWHAQHLHEWPRITGEIFLAGFDALAKCLIDMRQFQRCGTGEWGDVVIKCHRVMYYRQ